MNPSIFFLLFYFFFYPVSYAAAGTKAMAATAHPLATDTALDILKKGGSAADAAIAAQWVLNVVEPQSSGIGGGGFFLYYDAASKIVSSYDGRETAPAAAFAGMFLNEKGEPYPFRPDRVTGGLPVGVPGVLKLLKKVHEEFGSGRFSFAELFEPAIRTAENGFPVSKRLAFFLDREKERLGLFPASRRIFFNAQGAPLGEGQLLIQPDLAATFRAVQEKGIEIFYEGEIGKDIVRAVRTAPFHPGLMAASDLADYAVKERGPLRGNYRGHEIYSMGPPSSGGTTLLEALNILELSAVPSTDLISRAQFLAFQDRNRFLGDPDFTEIPVGKLISKEYAREKAGNVGAGSPRPVSKGAETAPLQTTDQTTHTSHLSIVDESGNMVAFTTTIEEVFGSAMVVPGRGFLLNNELTDFEAEPLVVGSDPIKRGQTPLHPNAPGPGKRPRSSMTPTFIFKEGRPLLIVGSPGGSAIIGTVLNIIVNLLDHQMSLEEALAAPRVLNREGVPETEAPDRQFGNAQAVYFKPVPGTAGTGSPNPSRNVPGTEIIGASDSRGEGKARGY